MESNWAAEHLQVIRTLMERSAVYRRALAPIMIFNGILGLAGALIGHIARIHAPRCFILYWVGVAVLALAASFLLVRRQALKESESFWSPPTRRVTQALVPALAAGSIIGLIALQHVDSAPNQPGPVLALFWLPLIWVVLYGCAIHAAGFFMPRGMKIFGWIFILGGCGLLAMGIPDGVDRRVYAHGLMGFFFGLLHLGYGIYLYFTEQRKNAA